MNDAHTYAWRKSSFSSSSGTCVELALAPGGGLAIRNSNRPDAGALALTPSQLAGWLDGCRAGDLDDLTVP